MKNFFSKTKNENPFINNDNNDGENTEAMAEELKENAEIENTDSQEESIVEKQDEGKEVTEAAKEENQEQQDEYAVLKTQYDELNNNFIRLAADFDNYRKRQAQEREALLKYGAQECMKKIIEVVDNFDRAMQSVDKIEDIAKMKESFFVLNKQLMDSLTKLGLEQIKAVGEKFDPNMHEAVMQTQTDEYEEDTIIKELQKGYKLGDKVLRPAMVDVAVK